MRNIYIFITILIITSCSNNKNNEEDKDFNISKTIEDTVVLGKETEERVFDFYSNHENKKVEEILKITNFSSEEVININDLKFEIKSKYVNVDSTIQLLNENGELIFSCPKLIKSEESSINVVYLGYNENIKFHILQYDDVMVPHLYYDMVGTNYTDTIRLNSKPKINTKGYLVDIVSNIYDDLTYFNLYKFKDGRIQLIFTCSFDQWMATQYNDEIWWSSEAELIVPYWETKDYWKNKDKQPKERLKITILR